MLFVFYCIFLLTLLSNTFAAPTTESKNSPNSRQAKSLKCNCECGGADMRGERVVGGEETKSHEFPWMAGLKLNGEFYCGGSLITKKHVLTAAHCVHGIDMSKVKVILADHDRNSIENNENIVERTVLGVRQHQKFEASNYNNDIAVIELNEPVDFGDKIKPVCLPTTTETNYTSRVAVVSGWGRLEEKKQPSPVLRKVRVPVWSREECLKDSDYLTKKLTENMFCAGYRTGKHDACQGDSGGPLQMMENGHMEIIGIVSWGRGCGRPNLPGVYTKVTNYLPWIKEALKGECLCSPKVQ